MDIRSGVEKSLGQAIPDSTWEYLISSHLFARECSNAERADGVVRATLVMRLAFVVQVIMDLALSPPQWPFFDGEDYGSTTERKPYKKPSAQARYKRVLEHLFLESIHQYARANDLVRSTLEGETVYDFDLAWHAERVFTPDVDVAEVYALWNELHPDEAFPTESAFIKKCQLALRQLEPSRYSESLRRVIRTDAKTRCSAPSAKKRQRARQKELSDIEVLRCFAEMHGFDASDWPTIAEAYNKLHGTEKTPRQLCNRYYKLEKEAKTKGWDNGFEFTFLDAYARRCRTQEEYLEKLKEVTSRFKKAAQDKPQAAP